MTRIVGIDPGLSGAITLIDTDDWSMTIADMPREPGRGDKNAVSPTGVVRVLDLMAPDYTFIEDVWTSPQMGVVSAGNFMRSLGIVLGAAASRSIITMLRPGEWKSKTQTPKNKNEARRRAQQLFPCAYDLFVRVKDDGRAESAIITFYGLLSLKLAPPRPLILKPLPTTLI